eukprot:CAMPEP_0115426604 /NCGR_PEP_ID=MMETSP0271-20121206/29001_1 /TAXON_ID=71861 /ORGANISM="Scrippsiella trochoidea, Strain CCMP3099" /LENGTH=366 /DNA_ID=CAMNT_0002851579 /DNA_START=72 /DNA_END=1175 /DNA_ORIENTATION=-
MAGPTLPVGPQMYEYLEELRSEDPARVLIVRGLGGLGFQSQEILQAYFSSFGEVARVLIPHPLVTSKTDGHQRVRPARMGFVVMGSHSGVDLALAAGTEQQLHTSRLRLQRFERKERPMGCDTLCSPESAKCMDVSPKDAGDASAGMPAQKLTSKDVSARPKAMLRETIDSTRCCSGQVAGAVATAAATISEVAEGLGAETPDLKQLSGALSQLASLIQFQSPSEPYLGMLTEHAAATVLAEASAADAMLRHRRAQDELQRLQASSPLPQLFGKQACFRPPPGLELEHGQQSRLQQPAQMQQRLWPTVAAATTEDEDCGPNASGFVTPRSISRSTSAASLVSTRSTLQASDGSNRSALSRSAAVLS